MATTDQAPVNFPLSPLRHSLPDRWPWILVSRQPRMTPKLSQCVLPIRDHAVGKTRKEQVGSRERGRIRINPSLHSVKDQVIVLRVGSQQRAPVSKMMNGVLYVFDWMARWHHHRDGHSLCHSARITQWKAGTVFVRWYRKKPTALVSFYFFQWYEFWGMRTVGPCVCEESRFYTLIQLLMTDCSEQ